MSGDYFRGLGIPPAAGRLIGPDDDRAGAPGTAVVSFALSQKRFGGPENAPGQSIQINNLPFTVIGVAPPEFFGADPGRASGRLRSDARQPASGRPALLGRHLPRPELRLGRADGAPASRRQRVAGTGGGWSARSPNGRAPRARSAGRTTFPLCS